MVVDFEIKKSPGFTAITVSWKGSWDEKRIRKEFEALSTWAGRHRLRTGHWMFQETGQRKFTAAIAVKGGAKGDGRVRVRKVSPSHVAQVVFDPDEVSPRVVYHGLNDWLRWRKKDKTIRSVGAYREVYATNPWTNAKAWASTTVQVVVRK